MILYKIETQASSLIWTHREYILRDSDEDAQAYVDDLMAKKPYKYRYERLQDMSKELGSRSVQSDSTKESSNTQDLKTQLQDVEWEESYDTDEFPRGWWLQHEFVAKDGTVFNKKEVVPEKYRTLLPSEY